MGGHFVMAANELQLFEEWVTPFYRFSDSLPRVKILEQFLAPFKLSNIPITVQIMGSNPEILAKGAKMFADLGVTGIDLNCGCPSRQVTSGGAGGGALRDVDNILRILTAVKDAIGNLPLSIKMRTGYQDFHEQESSLPRLEALGVLAQITMHFRTVAEQYRPVKNREERWRLSRELLNVTPLILNGDIVSVEELQELPATLKAQGAMVARGVLQDPFLLRRARGLSAPSLEEGRELFFATALKQYNEGITVGQAIELSNFIWGKSNPYFERLKAHKGMVAKTFTQIPKLYCKAR